MPCNDNYGTGNGNVFAQINLRYKNSPQDKLKEEKKNSLVSKKDEFLKQERGKCILVSKDIYKIVKSGELSHQIFYFFTSLIITSLSTSLIKVSSFSKKLNAK